MRSPDEVTAELSDEEIETKDSLIRQIEEYFETHPNKNRLDLTTRPTPLRIWNVVVDEALTAGWEVQRRGPTRLVFSRPGL